MPRKYTQSPSRLKFIPSPVHTIPMLRIAAILIVTMIIAGPANAGVELRCKKTQSPMLPPTLCVMEHAEWDALPPIQQAKCPEHVIELCRRDKSVRTRYVTPKRRIWLLEGIRRGVSRIHLIEERKSRIQLLRF